MTTINGCPVPSRMTLKQIQAMFPQGMGGLRDPFGASVFPDEDGVLAFQHSGNYTLPTSQGSSGGGGGGVPTTFSQRTNMVDLSPVDATPQQPPFLTTHRGKTIQDRIHDHITMPPLLVAVIDTPEFQRLRGLKQLGSTHYLYPGATHTRFEHSLGVAHLGGVMVRHLRSQQPELNITYQDEMCVMLAGLCHDLGHGPFSHLFEDFVNHHRPKRWRHEEMSVQLFDYLVRYHNIQFENFGLKEEDKIFVTQLIKGLKPKAMFPTRGGRLESKRFLFDIVANKRNGIDVDKLDYFMRDSSGCWGKSTAECPVSRLIKCSRAILFQNEWQICYEEKTALSLGDIFGLRAKLHKNVYQHRIVKVIDQMVLDALHLANDHFLIPGSEGKLMRISDCVDDVVAYTRLGDWILEAIEASPNPELHASQGVLARIRSRDLYHLAGLAVIRVGESVKESDVLDEVLKNIPTQALRVSANDVVVHIARITYGSSDSSGIADDPINHVGFFNPKKDADIAFHLSTKRKSPLFTPTSFDETTIFAYAKSIDQLLPVTIAFESWKEEHADQITTPVPTMNFSPGMKRRALEHQGHIVYQTLSQLSGTPER